MAGHVILIDFGFVFGIAPGGWFSLKQSTLFKLTDEMLAVIVGDNAKGAKQGAEPTTARPAVKVRFAVDMEACAGPTVEPTKQDQRAPIKMVSGCAWSPGIYQALRLLGKSLDVAWERAFIHPLTFN